MPPDWMSGHGKFGQVFRPTAKAGPCNRSAPFTPDLHHLANWLVASGVDTVAMESTGIYWIAIFEILEARGLKVYLVNARHRKNVRGRKSAIQGGQWLQKLHALGLLSGVIPARWRKVCTARLSAPSCPTHRTPGPPYIAYAE